MDNESLGNIETFAAGCINVLITEWKGAAKFSLAFLPNPALSNPPTDFFVSILLCEIVFMLPKTEFSFLESSENFENAT